MDESPSPLMTRAEAAEYLRVDVRTVDRYAEAGHLSRRRIAGTQAVRFVRAEVLALFEAEPAQ